MSLCTQLVPIQATDVTARTTATSSLAQDVKDAILPRGQTQISGNEFKITV
jgi:hypothetical protein